MTLRAPLYAPATSYLPPAAAPDNAAPVLDTLSVKELLDVPELRAMLYAAPGFAHLAEETQMKDHLGNTTLPSLSGLFGPERLAAIGARVAALNIPWAAYR